MNREMSQGKIIVTNSFQALEGLKKDLERQEPIENARGNGITAALLSSTASKKILKYLLKTYPEAFDKYAKKKEKVEFVDNLKKILASKEDLNEKDLLSIDGIYPYLLRIIPLTEKGNSSWYGKMAIEAGCASEEIEEAVKLLGAYNNRVLDRVFKKSKNEEETA